MATSRVTISTKSKHLAAERLYEAMPKCDLLDGCPPMRQIDGKLVRKDRPG
jgi:hypothetical protein